MRILDVGGGADWDWGDWAGTPPELTLLNLDVKPSRNGHVCYVQGDAREMSDFRDKEFDLVFSNSVIEHVGTFADQQRMAAEVRRVARAYWVQTPYRHFPIEPHMLFPFFQYLPTSWRRVIGLHWPLSFQKLRNKDPLRDALGVRLLDHREMTHCFPDATIIRERFLGCTKSLIAYSQSPSDVEGS
jgi:hypothetical protein